VTREEFIGRMNALLKVSEDMRKHGLYYLLAFGWSYKVSRYYYDNFPNNTKILREMYPEFMFENDETCKIIEEDFMCLKELSWQMFLDWSLDNELYLEY